MKYKHRFLLALFFSIVSFVYSQDSTFNSFNNGLFTNMYLNPAYTGAEKNCNIYLTFNDYYPGLNNIIPYGYLTMSDIAFGKKKQFGVGLTFVSENTNTFKARQLVTSFSGSATIYTKTTIKYGLAFSPFFKVSSNKNNDNNVFPDQFNPIVGPVYPTSEILTITSRTVSIIGNIKGGIWVDNPNFFLGISFGNFYIKKKFSDNLESNLNHFNNYNKFEENSYLALFPLSITLGYNLKFNDVVITPHLYSYVFESGNANRALLNFSINGTYKNKYLLSFSGISKSGILEFGAGAFVFKRYKIIASYGMFKNRYLRNITGAAYVGLGLNIQLTKKTL